MPGKGGRPLGDVFFNTIWLKIKPLLRLPVRFANAGRGNPPMKKSRFGEQQTAFILKQAEDGTTVEDVCRKAGISIQTYHR